MSKEQSANNAIHVDDVFLRDYGLLHIWTVRYFMMGESLPLYQFFVDRKDAYNWAQEHGWPN